jgi:hypothetical protein
VINQRTCKIPITPTPGGTLLYLQGQVNGGYINVGLTDSGNHTWTQLVSLNQGACFSGIHTAGCVAGYLANAPAGITSVTMTIDAVPDNGACSVAEYTNIDPLTPVDVWGTPVASTSVSSWSSTPISTTNANDLLIGFSVGTASAGSSNMTVSGPWVLATIGDGVGGQSMISDRVVTSVQNNIANTGMQSNLNTSEESAVFSFRQAQH